MAEWAGECVGLSFILDRNNELRAVSNLHRAVGHPRHRLQRFDRHELSLGVFAEQDVRVNAGKDKLEAALTAAGLVHELRVVPAVDHAFFNDTGLRFNLAAAQASYIELLAWFGKYFR